MQSLLYKLPLKLQFKLFSLLPESSWYSWILGYRWHTPPFVDGTIQNARVTRNGFLEYGFPPDQVVIKMTPDGYYQVKVWCNDDEWTNWEIPF